ncbi:hypothetical protein Tco_0743305 [Tanacetum coccineum]
MQLTEDSKKLLNASNMENFHCSKAQRCLIKPLIGFTIYDSVLGRFLKSTGHGSFLLMAYETIGFDKSKVGLTQSKVMSSKEEPKVVRKNDNALVIEEWVSNDEEEDVSLPKIEKKTVRPRNMSYLTDYEEIDGGYVAFGGNPKGGKITGKESDEFE